MGLREWEESGRDGILTPPAVMRRDEDDPARLMSLLPLLQRHYAPLPVSPDTAKCNCSALVVWWVVCNGKGYKRTVGPIGMADQSGQILRAFDGYSALGFNNDDLHRLVELAKISDGAKYLANPLLCVTEAEWQAYHRVPRMVQEHNVDSACPVPGMKRYTGPPPAIEQRLRSCLTMEESFRWLLTECILKYK